MVKIAVCEDILDDLEIIKNSLKTYKNLYPQNLFTVDYFINPIKLLESLDKGLGYDLYILAINLKPLKGSEVALEIKSVYKDAQIIFTTACKDHAIFAYQIGALQYLLKPVSKDLFFQTLNKFFKKLNKIENQVIILKTNKGIFKVNTGEIVYSKPERNNYQAIILADTSKLVVRITVADLHTLLSINPNIVRCGASLNINLSFIRKLNDHLIIFDNNLKLNFPYKAYSKLRQDFLNYHLISKNPRKEPSRP